MILVNVAVNPRPRISPRIPLCPSQNDLLTNALHPSIVSKGHSPSDGPPAMADSRDEDDEDSRDDSTEHGQQPDGYSLWVCIRVCEGGVCHTEQAAVAVNLVEEVEQALRSGISRHMAGRGRNTPRGEW